MRTPARLAALLCLLAPAAIGAEGIDPEARKLLDEVAAAYRAQGAYADSGTLTVEVKVGETPVKVQTPMAIRWQGPNRLLLDAGEVRVVCDGEILTTVTVPTRSYRSAPAPERLTLPSLTEGPAGALLLGGPQGLPAFVPVLLLLGDEPVARLLDGAEGLSREEDRTVEGQRLASVRIDRGQRPALRLLIDPETKLVRRAELAIDPNTLAERAPGGTALERPTVAWQSGPIVLDESDEEAFAFHAPGGFTPVASVAERKGAKPAAPEPPAHALVGQEAPEFSLTVLDGEGKTRQVTRADLKGKVVLIDFWATWCPPCMKELPELQGLVDDYARSHPDDVVVVALSEDSDPDEPEPLRKLVESTLADRGLTLAGGPVSLVALDPKGIVGNAFQVKALPTIFLLDREGRIQSAHIGYSDDVRDVLSRDLDTLLAGDSLAAPRAEEEAKPKPGALIRD